MELGETSFEALLAATRVSANEARAAGGESSSPLYWRSIEREETRECVRIDRFFSRPGGHLIVVLTARQPSWHLRPVAVTIGTSRYVDVWTAFGDGVACEVDAGPRSFDVDVQIEPSKDAENPQCCPDRTQVRSTRELLAVLAAVRRNLRDRPAGLGNHMVSLRRQVFGTGSPSSAERRPVGVAFDAIQTWLDCQRSGSTEQERLSAADCRHRLRHDRPLEAVRKVTVPIVCVIPGTRKGCVVRFVVELISGSSEVCYQDPDWAISNLIDGEFRDAVTNAWQAAIGRDKAAGFAARWHLETLEGEPVAVAISGPSAGLTAGCAFVDALNEREPDPELVISGTVDKDGKVGTVNEVATKASYLAEQRREGAVHDTLVVVGEQDAALARAVVENEQNLVVVGWGEAGSPFEAAGLETRTAGSGDKSSKRIWEVRSRTALETIAYLEQRAQQSARGSSIFHDAALRFDRHPDKDARLPVPIQIARIKGKDSTSAALADRLIASVDDSPPPRIVEALRAQHAHVLVEGTSSKDLSEALGSQLLAAGYAWTDGTRRRTPWLYPAGAIALIAIGLGFGFGFGRTSEKPPDAPVVADHQTPPNPPPQIAPPPAPPSLEPPPRKLKVKTGTLVPPVPIPNDTMKRGAREKRPETSGTLDGDEDAR